MRALNDEEIGASITKAHNGNIRGSDFIEEARPAVKAQYQQDIEGFIEWGNSACPHAGPVDDDPTQEKKYCNSCWQSLKQLVEEK